MTTQKITVLELDMIEPNPNQPRKFFNKEELANLANNIADHGILQPVTVRPNPEEKDHYILVAGERRWRASRIAGNTTIPAIIRRDLTVDEIEEAAIFENTARTDLNAIEEARSFESLRERVLAEQLYTKKQVIEQVARKVGKSSDFVEGRLSLLTLSEDIIRLIEVGQLGPTTGRTIARLPREHQHRAMRAIVQEGIGDTALKLFVDQLLASINSPEMFTDEQVMERTRQARDLRTRFDRTIEDAVKGVNLLVNKNTKQLLGDALRGDYDFYIAKLRTLENETRRLREEVEAARSVASVLDPVDADEVPA